MHKQLWLMVFVLISSSAMAEIRLGLVENAYPSFSPDGRRILFQSNRSGNWELYTMNADGTGILQLTSNPATDATAAFSHDGKHVIFVSDREGNEEIYVMDADGKNPKNVSRNPAGDSHPAWSYDGKRIVFCSTRGDGENDDVYSMNADGTDVRRLTDNGLYWDTFPSYSPDGSRIVFRRLLRIRTEEGTAINSEIFVMNADGSGATNLSKSGHFDGWPSWSPDGTKIAFASNRDDVYQIYVMKADGSEQRRVIQSFYTDIRPQWSPNGSQIVFNREYQGASEILLEPVSIDPSVPLTSENLMLDDRSSIPIYSTR